MPTASARHILVDDETLCQELKAQIEGGADFEDLAAEHSTCPSGLLGGMLGGGLGELKPGAMAKEIDDVVFHKELGVLHGPIQSPYGYHLIEIMERKD